MHDTRSANNISCSQSQCGNYSLLSQMVKDEVAMRSANDHETLSQNSCRCTPNLIWREKVTQWCYAVVDHLNERRDLVFISMNILDRYSALHNNSGTNERAYEAGALTALFLAVRISGGRSLAAPDLVRMSRLGITIQEIVNVGKAMTASLFWDIGVLTPVDFCNAFTRLLPVPPNDSSIVSILNTCRYLSEISVCDIAFSGVAASKIAFAAFLNAVGTDGLSGLSREQRTLLFTQIEETTGLSSDDAVVATLRARLHCIYSESQGNNQGGPHIIFDSEGDFVRAVSVPRPVCTRVVSCEHLSKTRPIARSIKCSSLSSSTPELVRNVNNKRVISPCHSEHALKRQRSASL